MLNITFLQTQKTHYIAVTGFPYLESVRYAVEYRGAHSGSEPHSKVPLMFFNGIHWALRWPSRSFTRGFRDTQPTLRSTA